jgi:hypothetical protein
MNQSLKFPPWLLILDVAGTILLALGLFGRFGGDNLFAPFAIPLIIIGTLLMLPLLVFLVTRVTSRG